MKFLSRMAILLPALLICNASVAAESLEGSKYRLTQYQLDLTENVTFDAFLTEQQFSFVVRDLIEEMLRRSNKLAQQGEENVAELNIYTDYFRHFVGDGSPLPIAVLAPNRISVSIDAAKNGASAFSFKRADLSTNRNLFSLLGARIGTESKRDYQEAYEVAYYIVKQIAEQAKDFSAPRDQDMIELAGRIEAYQSKFKTLSQEPLPFYVPDDVVEAYLVGLDSPVVDDRIKNLRQISTDWLFNAKLHAAVRGRVEKLASAPLDKEGEKEIRFGLNALASFGLADDNALFEKLQQSQGLPKGVLKEIEESKGILSKRNTQNKIVHRLAGDLESTSWEVKQLANRLRLAETKDTLLAINRTKRAYPREAMLLDAMKDRLEREAAKDNFRVWKYADIHAHMCKAIAASGNVEYLRALDATARTAHVESVREHCQASTKILTKVAKTVPRS